MKQIPLSQGKVALVSDEDYYVVSLFKWYATMNTHYYGDKRKQQKWYAKRNTWCYETKRDVTIYMHRFILKAAKGTVVDHIDGDGLNNQRENLREGTHAENNERLPQRWASKVEEPW